MLRKKYLIIPTCVLSFSLIFAPKNNSNLEQEIKQDRIVSHKRLEFDRIQALIDAITINDEEKVKKLSRERDKTALYSVYTDNSDNHFCSLLSIAVLFSQPNMVEFLVSKGFKPYLEEEEMQPIARASRMYKSAWSLNEREKALKKINVLSFHLLTKDSQEKE